MPGTSKKISRLEREAFLRAKDSEYKREQSSYLLTDSYKDDEETFENERHRRYDIIRQTHQIQREIDHQVGMMDKLNGRKQQELQKRHTPIPTSTARSYLTSSASSTSSSLTERPNRSGGATEKYASKTHTTGSKLQ